MRIAKRIIALLLLVLLILPAVPAGAAKEVPSRVIHVVYDDSGSMIETDDHKELVDTWCQAKYAMEVFAAMLEEKDTMKIYYMSDFSSGQTDAPPKLSLSGSDGAATNVEKIHSLITMARNTPFNTVRKAYTDLESASADEKWLIVLTDGVFQGVDDVDGFFADKQEDIKVMYLAMGDNASEIKEDEDRNLFFEHAASNDQILRRITDICTRIFQRNRLEINVSSKKVDFDVPMGELVVFAQGANVKINSIVDEDGNKYLCSTQPVTVQYSERPATNYNNFIVARNLTGSIASFKDDFSAGDYTIDVSGADIIEVYYKPNVEIAAYLFDKEGNEVTNLATIESGDYTIEFGFVKAGTNEKVGQSKLLGKVDYEAYITNNGSSDGKSYASGDKVTIQEGSLQIDVTAYFLDYYSVSTHLDFSVFANKEVSFRQCNDPAYEVTTEGLQVTEPIQIEMLVEGQPLTQQQWDEAGLITVEALRLEGCPDYGDFIVEKSDTPGVYLLTPTTKGLLLSSNLYQNGEFTVSYSQLHGEASWTGEGEGGFKVTDVRTWLERYLQEVIKYLVIGGFIFLFLGYIPPFKKYLPRRLKTRPTIDCSPNRPGVHQMTARGKLSKSTLTTLLPYKAQEGTLKFVPPGVTGVPQLKLKALGGNAMQIMNTQAFEKKDHITFNGSPVEEGQNKVRISAGAMISVNTREMTYTCIPNQ